MRIKDLFDGRVCTISNFLSILRVLLVPFVAYTLYREGYTGNASYRYYSLLLLLLIALTDFLDGYLARLLDQVSRLGQFLDPIADKITAYSLGFLIVYYRDFPLWIMGIILCRDIFSLVGGYLLFSRRDIQARPNVYGKLMVVSLGAGGALFIAFPSGDIAMMVKTASLAVILFFIIISAIQYWKTYSAIYFPGRNRKKA